MITYPSKLLLFGEYTILKGGRALAIPYHRYHGVIKPEASNEMNSSQKALRLWASEVQHQIFSFEFDKERFINDLERGMYFSSSIPLGQGLGSSGALTAAIYERYADSEWRNRPTLQLKNELAELESHFHGKSSGLDPLVSLLKTPLLIEREGPTPIDGPSLKNIFLLHTKQGRETGPLVTKFMEKLKVDRERYIFSNELLPLSNQTLDLLLDGRNDELVAKVQELSAIQREFFEGFIPKELEPLWDRGLESKDFALKVCGAGGGGVFLMFSKLGEQDLKELCSPFVIEKI